MTEVASSAGFKIKTSNFEGPLGLLLHLIESRKLFINDVSLAQVTNDYLSHVSKLTNTSLPAGRQAEEVSSFIVVAATLILIKSKSLLPELDLSSEEEGDIKRLEERLRLYKIFMEISARVRKNFGKHIIFPGEGRKMETVVFLPDSQITKESMMGFARDVLGRVPTQVFLPEVEVKKVVSMEEMIDRLTERIKNAVRMSFQEFAQPEAGRRPGAMTREEKVEVIVSFLAMLELVRNGILNAIQEANSEEIMIEKINL